MGEPAAPAYELVVVTATGVVAAGNGTLAAARALGWKSIQVVRTGLTGIDLTAFTGKQGALCLK